MLRGVVVEMRLDIRRSLASQVANGWPLSRVEPVAGSRIPDSASVVGPTMLSISALSGAIVVPPLPLLLSPTGGVLGESVLYPAASVLSADLPAELDVVIRRDLPGKHMLLCGQYSQYFWHWMTEYLPRVLVAERAGFDGSFVLQNDPPRFVTESLALLGVPPGRIDMLGTEAKSIEELWVPTPWTGTAGHGRLALEEIPNLIGELRERLLAASGEGDGSQRIYLARAGAPRGRNIRNETELRDLLGRFGFQPVVMEELSLDAQIRLMRGVKIVAGPHGAGMVHAFVMSRGATILEFLPHGFAPTTNHFLHRLYDQRYQAIEGRPLSDATMVHPNLADIELDLNLVSDWLRKYCTD